MASGHWTLPSAINSLRDHTSMAGLPYPVHGYPDDDYDYDENMRSGPTRERNGPAPASKEYDEF